MRLLYVTDALAIWGGLERILVEKANFLAEKCGYDVHFITVNQGSHQVLFPLSPQVHYTDLDIRFHQQYEYKGLWRLMKKMELKRLFIERLRKYVHDITPDIILTARLPLIPGIVAVKGNIPLIYESHSSYISELYLSNGRFVQLKSRYINRNVRYAQMVVALTDGDASEWKRIASNVCVIPNIVSLNKSGLYSNCNSKVVIFVGRFSKQKDIHSLLKIWSIVSSRFPDWHLHIYGGFGEEQTYFVDYIKNKYTSIDIFPPTNKIFDKYRESSMLILTSLFEPFGLVLPEAMSCGLPVVAFDCPYGPSDIIRDGIDGFIIDNRDVNKFAEKVCLLMGNHDLRVKMGNEGIKSSSRYEETKIMPKWVQLFQSLVE